MPTFWPECTGLLQGEKGKGVKESKGVLCPEEDQCILVEMLGQGIQSVSSWYRKKTLPFMQQPAEKSPLHRWSDML